MKTLASMRWLMLIAASSVAYAQPYILENWTCYQITGIHNNGDGTTNLTCNTPHGLTGGPFHFVFRGGTGAWQAINTQDENISNGARIGTTDTSILLNDTTFVPNGLLQLSSEYVNVTSKDAGRVYLSQGSGLGCDANGHACNGTTAVNHEAQCGCITSYVLTNPATWNATIIDANTIKIFLDSSSLGTFSGQTVYAYRARNSDSTPVIQAYNSQPWSLFQLPGSEGLKVTIPGCTSTTDAFECSRGFESPIGGKGYSYSTTGGPGAIPITTMVVSGTAPNQTVTINFASYPGDIPNNGVLQAMSGNTNPNKMGSLVFVLGVNEAGLGVAYGSLDRAYIVSSVLTCTGVKCGITAKIGEVTTLAPIANGTYSPSGATMVLPWPTDGYTDMCPGACNNAAATLSGYSKNGWSATANRLRIYTRYKGIAAPLNRTLSNGLGMDIGTYFINSGSGDLNHGYHAPQFAISDNQWIMFEYGRSHDGTVNCSGSCPDPSYDPNFVAPQIYTGSSWLGYVGHYWDIQTRLYWDDSSTDPLTIPIAGSERTYSAWLIDNESGQPVDELVKNRTIQYDGTKYLISVDGPIYSSSWFGVTPISYQFRYSTTTDLKSAGFSTGTLIGTTTNNTLSGAPNSAAIATGAMAASPTIYVGVRATTGINNISGSGVSPITIWTYPDIGPLSVGNLVTVASVGGNTAANQSNAAVTAVFPRQSWWRFAPGSPWSSTPGMISSIVVTGTNTCTLNAASPHGLLVGQPFYLNGGVPTGGPVEGGYFISSVGSSTAFNFATTRSGSTCGTGLSNGTYNTDNGSSAHMGVEILPGIQIAGTGNGTFTANTGTIVPTDDTINFSEMIFTTPISGCSITPTSVNPLTVGQSPTLTFTANNCGAGTKTWTVSSGALPAGLTGCASTTGTTCAATGTTTTAATYTPNIHVTDGGTNTADDALSIIVNAAPTITTTSLPNGTTGTAYSQTLATSGGTAPLVCAIQSGTLPTSLSISSGCVISGTPSAAATFSFVVSLTDANSVVGTKSLSIIISLPTSGAASTMRGKAKKRGNSKNR